MAAQIRPNRLDVTDRFPMLSFTIRTDAPPRAAEVVLVTDPLLMTSPEGRTSSNFYSSREHGLLSVPRGEAVYVVRPDVLARFIQADRLYFGLATASQPAANDWRVELAPTAASPYISLTSLSDRSLRRVRMFPSRTGQGYGAGGSKTLLEWAGDRSQPGTMPAQQPATNGAPATAAPANGTATNGASLAPAAANVPYDDGFGPLPPLQPAAEQTPPTASAAPPAATPPAPAAAQSYSRGLEVDPEDMGIDGPACTDDGSAIAMAAGLSLGDKEYDGASRTAPSPAFTTGRAGTAIDRIVIHITDAPTTGSTVSHFTREGANSSAHYLVGQDGEVVQFVSESDTAWHARGANRRSIGIEHVAVKQGGATYGKTTFPHMPPTEAEYRASATLVAQLCRKYGLTPDRTTIIGHREADGGTSHTSCPDGAWDWGAYMALVAECYAVTGAAPAAQSLSRRASAGALGADGETVEIKYRVFIPAPLIKGPNSGFDLGPIASGEDFSGDNRGFSYDQGTSRAEITATLVLDANSGISGLQTKQRGWGKSKAYDSTYTYHVEGKPDWWLDKQAGLDELRHATLPVSDDNLSIVQGAPGTQRNVLAMTSQSSVVTITVAGALPLISPSPDIDADISVFLKRGADGGIQAMIVGDHDGFPCHELYINRQRVHAYDPVAAGNDPTNLLPPSDIDVSTDWIAIPSLATASAQGMARAQALTRSQSTARYPRALDAEDWSINWDGVLPIGQPTKVSCWATAAAMIDGWRREQSVSIDAIAQFDNLSTQNGLPPKSSKRFGDAIGFTAHPNACYTPEGFRDLIESGGPIWVVARVPGLHAIVVTGMYRKDGAYYVRITDPWDRLVGDPGAPGDYAETHLTGSQYIMSYDAFAAEFEAAGDTEATQLLHGGGTLGRTINRGSAAPAGYALSARGLSDEAPAAAPAPVLVAAGDASLGIGTALSRATSEKNGRRYDLAQLAGFVEPGNALAGGAGVAALPGARVVLDDWPYIEGPSGRTQAGVAIDWQYRGGTVGEIVVAPIDGQVLDGWTAAVRADIAANGTTPDRASLKIRVTTTFSRPDEEDQIAVTEVTLSGDGRQATVHGADRVPEPAASPAPASDAALPQMATA